MLSAACGEGPWNNPYSSDRDDESIFYRSFSERPKHLDPVSSYSENEAQFTAQIYEPVVQYHFLKRPYELVPLTADSVPRPIYRDSLGNELTAEAPAERVHSVVYRIKVQAGIMFQPHPAFATNNDGKLVYKNLSETELEKFHVLGDFSKTGTRELTAADYVYQIKRLAHPRIHSPIAGFMGRYIVGLNELQDELKAIASNDKNFIDLRDHQLLGVKQVDRYTYEIQLAEKYPQFVYWLAMPFFAPIPWEADKFYSQPGMKERNITLDWFPVGTGPYMLTENNPNGRMVLRKNPNFHGETYPSIGMPSDVDAGWLRSAGKPLPFIDSVVYSLEKEAIPGWTKFLQGYYDSSGIVSDSFDQAVQFSSSGDAELTAEMRDRNIKLATTIRPSTSYLGFNMIDEVVGGDSERARLLRRAISIAVDYEEFISIFANGRGSPAQGPVPPGIFGNVEGPSGINPYVYDWADGKARRKSLEHAKQLLAQAGYPNGRDEETSEPLTLYFEAVSSGPGSKSVFNWYRKQFEKLGIQLVIRTTDYNRFQEKIRKGTAQIFSWGWNADYPDPENFLFLLFGPNAKTVSQGENAANYQNSEFDELFVKMRGLPNGQERQETIDLMIDMLRRDSPWIWGYHPKNYSLYHQWYGNSKPNLMARNTLKYRTISPIVRTQMRAAWNQPIIWPVVVFVVLLIVSGIPAYRTYRKRQTETLT
ncbi:MAG: oligopeptide transport system substrate-binding protein [Gammaproteobacteria bacterium]|jgi:oligopeptide transport system substrate-binding protein